jgi:surface protein
VHTSSLYFCSTFPCISLPKTRLCKYAPTVLYQETLHCTPWSCRHEKQGYCATTAPAHGGLCGEHCSRTFRHGVFGVFAYYTVANEFKTIGNGKPHYIQSLTTRHRPGRTRRLGPKLVATRVGTTPVAGLLQHQDVDHDRRFSGKRIGGENRKDGTIIRTLTSVYSKSKGGSTVIRTAVPSSYYQGKNKPKDKGIPHLVYKIGSKGGDQVKGRGKGKSGSKGGSKAESKGKGKGKSKGFEFFNSPGQLRFQSPQQSQLQQAVPDYLGPYSDAKTAVAETFGKPIGVWCVANIADFSALFAYQSGFNEDISNWDVSSGTDMGGMFLIPQHSTKIS